MESMFRSAALKADALPLGHQAVSPMLERQFRSWLNFQGLVCVLSGSHHQDVGFFFLVLCTPFLHYQLIELMVPVSR